MKRKIGFSVLGLLLVAVAFFWLSQSGWLEDFNQEQNQEFQQFTQKGEALGRTVGQQECLDQALKSFDGCMDFRCTVGHGKFLRACLNNASPEPAFCEDVPEFREKPTEDDKNWAKYYCRDHEIKGDGCRLLMRQQALFCSQSKH
ncbi:MAG: hypothetical protein ACPGF7_00690 [Pontibacterium sp.]